MLNFNFSILMLLCINILQAACSKTDFYEKEVKNWEPVYCYQTIGRVQCHKKPKSMDKKRIVSFFGPAPETYEKYKKDRREKLSPPKMIKNWFKDPEPIPGF